MESGSFQGSTNNQYIVPQINWSSTSDVANNRSSVTATLYLIRTNNYTTYGTGTWTIYINGQAASTTAYKTIGNSWVAIVSSTVTVNHDADGHKSIYIYATGGISGTSYTTTSIGATVALDSIPRASDFVLSTNAPVLGEPVSISITRKVSSYTHDISYSYGEHSGTIMTGVDTSASFTPALSAAAHFPTSVTQECTVTVTTKNGDTVVGTKTTTVTLTVPDNDQTRPVITSVTLSPTNALSGELSQSFAQGITGVSASIVASTAYSSNLTYSVSADGMTATGNPASTDPIRNSGSITVTATVTDGRGFKTTNTQTITVYAYEAPRVAPYTGTKIVCVRCNSSGVETEDGTYILFQCRRVFSTIAVGGVNKNLCALDFRVKTSGGSFGAWTNLLAGGAAQDTVNEFRSGVVPLVGTAYVVQIRASDTVGRETFVTLPVSAADFPLHAPEGGHGLAVGGMYDAAAPNQLQLRYPARFLHGFVPRTVFENLSWSAGVDIASIAPTADLTGLSNYTMFLAVMDTGSPSLCVRTNDTLYGLASTVLGGIATDCIRITINSDVSVTLTSAGGATITALYALM